MQTSAPAAVLDEVRYGWDRQYRLTDVDFDHDGNGTLDRHIGYTYDAAGHRVSQTNPSGQVTKNLTDVSQPYYQALIEYTLGGLIQASYVYGLNIVSQTRSNTTSFYVHDQHSGVRQLVGDSGAIAERERSGCAHGKRGRPTWLRTGAGPQPE